MPRLRARRRIKLALPVHIDTALTFGALLVCGLGCVLYGALGRAGDPAGMEPPATEGTLALVGCAACYLLGMRAPLLRKRMAGPVVLALGSLAWAFLEGALRFLPVQGSHRPAGIALLWALALYAAALRAGCIRRARQAGRPWRRQTNSLARWALGGTAAGVVLGLTLDPIAAAWPGFANVASGVAYALYGGGVFACWHVARQAARRFKRENNPAEADPFTQACAQLTVAYGLTPRECATLPHAAGDLPFSAIAREMGASAVTVRTHAQNIYRKLGVSGRDELREMVAQAAAQQPTATARSDAETPPASTPRNA